MRVLTHTRAHTALTARANQAKQGAASPCESHPGSAVSVILHLGTPGGKREFALNWLGTRSRDRGHLILGNAAETGPGTSLSC